VKGAALAYARPNVLFALVGPPAKTTLDAAESLFDPQTEPAIEKCKDSPLGARRTCTRCVERVRASKSADSRDNLLQEFSTCEADEALAVWPSTCHFESGRRASGWAFLGILESLLLRDSR